MAWCWGKKGGGDHSWNSEQPTSKKRKVEEQEKHDQKIDDWDDGEEFTQDELEALDLIASQAINQPEASVPPQRTVPHSEVSFVVPIGTARSTANRSTSSSSDSSVCPRSLSSRSTVETSITLSSSSSINDKLDQSRDILQTSLDLERKRALEEKYQYDGEVKSLRERLHKQEEELERLRAVRDESYDQQHQAEIDKCSKLQSQLDSLATQAKFKERECQSLQERNTILQNRMKRFEQQNHTSGQATILPPHSPKSVSPRKVYIQPSPPSKQKLQEMKESSGLEKTDFPTTYSFMEQAASSSIILSTMATASSVSCQTTEIPYATKPPQSRRLHLHTGVENAFGAMTGPQIVSHLLQDSVSEAALDRQDVFEQGQWDPGLVGLLNAMSTSLKIAGLTYSRGKDSSLLSPLRPLKKERLKSPDVSLSDGTVQVVTRQNLQLAIEGLTLLLDDTRVKVNQDRSKNGLESEKRIITGLDKTLDMNIQTGANFDHSLADQSDRQLSDACSSSHLDFVHSMSYGSRSSSVAHRRRHNSQLHNSGAVMILPLLTDYIHHYVNIIHSNLASGGDGLFTSAQGSVMTQPSLDSSNCGSSFDSFGSQIGQVLQEGRIHASCVEMYAVTALRCLVHLIRLCQEVGDTIIANHSTLTMSSSFSFGTSTTSSSSNMDTETEQQSKKLSSSVEADDEHSSSSSEVRVVSEALNQPQHLIGGRYPSDRAGSTLLHLIMRLAGQDPEDNQTNPESVKLALMALTSLSQSSTEEDLTKLETVITRGILTNCFKQTKHMQVLIWAQRLLVSLANSEKLLARLCTKSEHCPLFLMHRACAMKADDTVDLCREYITSLSCIISTHRSGLHLLLSNSCPCTDELVVSVIMAVYNLFSTYKTTESEHKPAILNTIAQGIILIHSLAQGDSAYGQHHMAVKLQYVRLLSGLASILRSDNLTWELQLSALEELCDFDISGSSQESDGEDKMDNS